MSDFPLASSRLRAAMEWWRSAANAGSPPEEATFVSQDARRYAQLLCDAFIVDATTSGDFTYRFVGTELSDYIGWSVPGQRLDLTARRKDSDLVREVLTRTAASLSPHVGFGRISGARSTVEAPSTDGEFEVICLPLRTSGDRATFFGAVALKGHWKLPPALQGQRASIDRVVDVNRLSTSAGGKAANDGGLSARAS